MSPILIQRKIEIASGIGTRSFRKPTVDRNRPSAPRWTSTRITLPQTYASGVRQPLMSLNSDIRIPNNWVDKMEVSAPTEVRGEQARQVLG